MGVLAQQKEALTSLISAALETLGVTGVTDRKSVV